MRLGIYLWVGDRKYWVWLCLAVGSALPWLIARFLGLGLSAPMSAVLSGLAVVGASFVLSWVAELAQIEISQALTFALIALMTVLPEYAVDIYFGWMAGKNPAYASYALATMTGANRLLIGLGWPALLWVYWLRRRRPEIQAQPENRAEIRALLFATLYSFVIPCRGSLSVWDAGIFILIFLSYLRAAYGSGLKAPDLEEGPALALSRFSKPVRRAATGVLFLWSGLVILASAKPFAEGLLETGRALHMEEFLIVQWLAPLASEAPEFIVALIFAWRLKPSSGFATLISSKVNQWTLLVGMLPLVFSASLGHPGSLPLDSRQSEEVLLTSAQSLFAVAVLADFRFLMTEAWLLFFLFISQFLFSSPAVRYGYAGLYFVLTGWILMTDRKRLKGLGALLHVG